MNNTVSEPIPWGVPQTAETSKEHKTNPLFSFMAIGSFLYALFYTFCLYKNKSGITYPFWVGGTCFFFFCYLKKCGLTAKKFSIFLTVSLGLLGLSTCMTESYALLFYNKLAIFFLFFYMVLHSLYEDKKWDLGDYFANIFHILFGSLIYIFAPFLDYADYSKEKKARQKKPEGKGKYVVYGILLALPMLFFILLLLGSADAVFGEILIRIFSFDMDENWGDDVFKIGGLFLCAFFSSYCLIYRLSEHNLKEDLPDKRTAEPVIAITFTGILSVVYAIFCLIQIVFLFGGLGTLPEGYTYASYAREGFFQLVFVCMINLCLVLICKKRFRDNLLLKMILSFICGCTYIMIASSTYRMLLYIKVYYLTFLRIFVLWALLVIFLLVTGALIHIYTAKFPLVKYCVGIVTVLYLLFSFAHPDYWIARYNLDHFYILETDENYDNYKVHYDDLHYLKGLSADAAPAIFDKMNTIASTLTPEQEEHLPYNYLNWHADYSARLLKRSYDNHIGHPLEDYLIPGKMPLRKFNFSKWRAYNAYTKYCDAHPEFVQEVKEELWA